MSAVMQQLPKHIICEICMNKRKITSGKQKGHQLVPGLLKQLSGQPVRRGCSCFVGIVSRLEGMLIACMKLRVV